MMMTDTPPRQADRRTAPTFRTSAETNTDVRTLAAELTAARHGRAVLMDHLLRAAVEIASDPGRRDGLLALIAQYESDQQTA